MPRTVAAKASKMWEGSKSKPARRRYILAVLLDSTCTKTLTVEPKVLRKHFWKGDIVYESAGVHVREGRAIQF